MGKQGLEHVGSLQVEPQRSQQSKHQSMGVAIALFLLGYGVTDMLSQRAVALPGQDRKSVV